MEIRLEEHTIREIFDGYKDSADNGVIAFGGNLTSDQPFSESLFIRKKNAMPSSIL